MKTNYSNRNIKCVVCSTFPIVHNFTEQPKTGERKQQITMYFPIGWPKVIDVFGLADQDIRKICCDRVKILFAVLTDDSLAIFYTNVSKYSLSVYTCNSSILAYLYKSIHREKDRWVKVPLFAFSFRCNRIEYIADNA